jgi:hypothetical protein
VLALSVSQTGDRRPKDSGGANHHNKTCKEITSKETNKQTFLYSTSKLHLLESLVKVWKGEEGKWKVVSPFSFFKSHLFIFYFLKCKGEQKQICSGKGENKMVDLGWERKLKCKWWKKGGKENGLTTSLPPIESFTFIVHEQDCLHTFEDYFAGATGDLVATSVASSRVFLPMRFLVDFLYTFFR